MALLEVCADGLDSAVAASIAGAQRIELCANLEAGGLTPSHGMLKVVSERLSTAVNVLIRPRRGDYVYTPAYMDVMLNDILMVKELGFNGVVIGALDKNGKLDKGQINEMIETAGGLSLTFHRAVDVASNPLDLLATLVDLGFDRVLTSGGKPTAIEGIKQIALYQKEFGKHIQIMAGSGVNATNAAALIQNTGISEVHSSAKRTVQFAYTHQACPELVADDWYYESDYAEIKALLRAVEAL